MYLKLNIYFAVWMCFSKGKCITLIPVHDWITLAKMHDNSKMTTYTTVDDVDSTCLYIVQIVQ